MFLFVLFLYKSICQLELTSCYGHCDIQGETEMFIIFYGFWVFTISYIVAKAGGDIAFKEGLSKWLVSFIFLQGTDDRYVCVLRAKKC